MTSGQAAFTYSQILIVLKSDNVCLCFLEDSPNPILTIYQTFFWAPKCGRRAPWVEPQHVLFVVRSKISVQLTMPTWLAGKSPFHTRLWFHGNLLNKKLWRWYTCIYTWNKNRRVNCWIEGGISVPNERKWSGHFQIPNFLNGQMMTHISRIYRYSLIYIYIVIYIYIYDYIWIMENTKLSSWKCRLKNKSRLVKKHTPLVGNLSFWLSDELSSFFYPSPPMKYWICQVLYTSMYMNIF